MHARSESAPGILPLVLFLIALPAHAAAADTPVQEAGRALTLELQRGDAAAIFARMTPPMRATAGSAEDLKRFREQVLAEAGPEQTVLSEGETAVGPYRTDRRLARHTRAARREYPQVPAGYAAWQLWQSPAHPHGDADLSAVSRRTDRDYSANRLSGAGCSCCRRATWSARHNARTARPLAHLQRHFSNDYVSSCVLAPKPGAFRKTQSLGRHAPSHGTPRVTNHRTATKLFPVTGFKLSKHGKSAGGPRL